ncbi:MAG: hypothetical protein U0359_32435 [Byssovorax sp.]
MNRSSIHAMLAAALAAGLATTGCATPVEDPAGPSLTIVGSTGSPASGSGPEKSAQGIPPGASVGTPSSVAIGLYSLYLGLTPDCADLQLAQDYGSQPLIVDLAASSTLFSTSPPDGAYPCVVFKMSDQIHFRTSTTFDACEAETDYVADVYRSGQTGYLDPDGLYVNGQGDDLNPVNDPFALVMTTSPTAAIAHGFDAHQVLGLASALTVPGTATFVWDAANTMMSVDGQCGVDPGQPGFF